MFKWFVLVVLIWWIYNTISQNDVNTDAVINSINEINQQVYSIVSLASLKERFGNFTVVNIEENGVKRMACPVGDTFLNWCNLNGKVCPDNHQMQITLDYQGSQICCIGVYKQKLAGFTIGSQCDNNGDI